MTRGRPPKKGLDEALPIAEARGRLMQFVNWPPFEYDFLFMSDERICCVWVKRTRHIWCTPEEMEAQFAEAIAKYRCLLAPADLTREIWYWSPYGVFRFFRIEKDGLIEIGRDGQDLTTLVKKTQPQRKPVRRGRRPVTVKGPEENEEEQHETREEQPEAESTEPARGARTPSPDTPQNASLDTPSGRLKIPPVDSPSEGGRG